jgi:methylmalonyl-CoA mutase cobalamin-binding domain/chain
MAEDLATAIVELDRDAIPVLIRERLEAGGPPSDILEECRSGMAIVGDRFQDGEYFLSELIISAELFKQAVALLEPHMPSVNAQTRAGKIVLATMRGDIHDLGKNLLVTLLRARGFDVHDLGVNVEPTELVAAVQEIEPDIVGFSSLITTSFESTKQAIEKIDELGMRGKLKVMIGGGVTTPELGNYLGADFQTQDAAAGVVYCLETMGG